jgi:hypothetical protein
MGTSESNRDKLKKPNIEETPRRHEEAGNLMTPLMLSFAEDEDSNYSSVCSLVGILRDERKEMPYMNKISSHAIPFNEMTVVMW